MARVHRRRRVVVLIGLLAVLPACGWPGGEPPPEPARIVITPNPVLIDLPETGSATVTTTITATNEGDLPTGALNASIFIENINTSGFAVGAGTNVGCDGAGLDAGEQCTITLVLIGNAAHATTGSVSVSDQANGIEDSAPITVD
jgi:hypothetical protein